MRRQACAGRGAVAVETALAMPVLLTFFLSLAQLSETMRIDLVMRHAVLMGTRTAIVSVNQPSPPPGEEGVTSDADVVVGSALSIAPWVESGAVTNLDASWTDSSTKDDPYGRLTVRLQADHKCRWPIGNLLVCRGRSRHIDVTASLPHQGFRGITSPYKM